YEQLFGEHGRQPSFAEAMILQARLLLFYAGDVALAKNQLEKITRLSVHPRFKAEAELLLGDVYLIQQEPLKALKQYQLVDSVLQDETQATQAKYRIARLNYFNGKFKLAKGQLKVLKDNTSNDISNDAIRLHLIIQDNLGMDTTEVPLQLFADAQLAAYQKRYEESTRLMDKILREYPEHGLRDEILWEKSQIALNRGETEQAISYLDAIIEKHGTDVWADDAVFTKAELMQFTLNKPKEAQELYLKILMDYSGSLYKVEARKRLRELRSRSL
ncbi:MAG: tetratricopeptide repeat protein, partial [Bacteroidota bacterium]